MSGELIAAIFAVSVAVVAALTSAVLGWLSIQATKDTVRLANKLALASAGAAARRRGYVAAYVAWTELVPAQSLVDAVVAGVRENPDAPYDPNDLPTLDIGFAWTLDRIVDLSVVLSAVDLGNLLNLITRARGLPTDFRLLALASKRDFALASLDDWLDHARAVRAVLDRARVMPDEDEPRLAPLTETEESA